MFVQLSGMCVKGFAYFDNQPKMCLFAWYIFWLFKVKAVQWVCSRCCYSTRICLLLKPAGYLGYGLEGRKQIFACFDLERILKLTPHDHFQFKLECEIVTIVVMCLNCIQSSWEKCAFYEIANHISWQCGGCDGEYHSMRN